jgi:phosphate transport system substrate-binding protein
MVLINQALKRSFEQQFPDTVVATDAKGTDKGILALLIGKADIAAISRPLTPEEEAQGLRAIPVAQDRIAIVIGVNNPFKPSLSSQQVADIFQGKITDWSAVSGVAAPIRVINRPPISGTHQTFQHLVLKDAPFGTTPNITTLTRDATTPILQQLGKDGIGYATFEQVIYQKTVKVVPIDGKTPESPQYPFQRTLYYAYKEPASPAVQAFLGFVTSSAGQQAIAQANP